MQSEWMVDVPEDLEENYFMVLCPVGKRCLIVASRGSTKCYNTDGSLAVTFSSSLEGGHYKKEYSCQKSTILDCIYESSTKTYYVLDLISFSHLQAFECDTECRWYWLETKFNENMPEAMIKTETNPYSFALASRFKCEKSIIERVFSEKLNFELDGILFYHKSNPYVFGFSPVTTWLKPYMLPEVIGVSVNELYLSNIPSWYSGFANHVEGVKKKAHEREEARKQKKKGKMTKKSKANGDNDDQIECDMDVTQEEE